MGQEVRDQEILLRREQIFQIFQRVPNIQQKQNHQRRKKLKIKSK